MLYTKLQRALCFKFIPQYSGRKMCVIKRAGMSEGDSHNHIGSLSPPAPIQYRHRIVE